MRGSSALDVLTEDLLVRVREKIGDELDSKTWRLVCKEFSRVDSVTRTTLRVLRVEFLFRLLDKYPNIKTLDLSVCPRVNDGTVSFLLSQHSLSWTRSLKSLILSRSTGLRYRGLSLGDTEAEVYNFYIFFPLITNYWTKVLF